MLGTFSSQMPYGMPQGMSGLGFNPQMMGGNPMMNPGIAVVFLFIFSILKGAPTGGANPGKPGNPQNFMPPNMSYLGMMGGNIDKSIPPTKQDEVRHILV